MGVNVDSPEGKARQILLDRVRAWCPDIPIRAARFGGDGMNNDAVIVNNELVFRFCRSANAAKKFQQEIAILKRLAGVTVLQIPELVREADGAICYRLIPGEPMRGDVLLKLSDEQFGENAKRLGRFFQEIHAMTGADLPASDNRMPKHFIESIYKDVKQAILPHVRSYVRLWAEDLFESFLANPANFQFQPRLIHGDLFPDHVLFDAPAQRITGIIDFGMAGMGDPAVDLATLIYNYGGALMKRMCESFPELDQYAVRASFYAQTFDFQWALTALRCKEVKWFLAHLGSAKDIGWSKAV